MKVIRNHDKKKYILSFSNLAIIFLGLFLLIIMHFNTNIYTNLIEKDLYVLYLITNVLITITPIILPLLIYKKEFESELIIKENSLLFKDIMDMFNVEFEKKDIKSIVRNDNKVILHMNNNKTFHFYLVEDNQDDNYRILVQFIS